MPILLQSSKLETLARKNYSLYGNIALRAIAQISATLMISVTV
jgi:hypothetical protein